MAILQIRCSTKPIALGSALLSVALSSPVLADYTPDDGDLFGHAVAAGDFDGDGMDDLAIGVPSDSAGGLSNAGLVEIHYGNGAWDGLDQTVLLGSPQKGDSFGHALASGDFDGDGFADLAIGVPHEGWGIPLREQSGAVQVVYGSSGGLDINRVQEWSQDSNGIAETAESFDYFGFSLAVGNFGEDGADDLAIGVPNESVGLVQAGAVHVIFGVIGQGLDAANDEFWSQDSDSIASPAEDGERFGHSLAAGNIGYTSRSDLVIGVPGQAGSPKGAIHILFGSSVGLLNSTDQYWAQIGDSLGTSLATGDFNGDGYDDVAAGMPNATVAGQAAAGAVRVFYGSSTGTSASSQAPLDQASLGGGAEANDQFGFALASLDLHLAVGERLVVGVPGEDNGQGSVQIVLWGFWSQAPSDIEGIAENGDGFGAAVCTGDFDGDGWFDLAVGVPGDNVPGANRAGAVNVIEGSAQTGLTGAGGSYYFQQ